VNKQERDQQQLEELRETLEGRRPAASLHKIPSAANATSKMTVRDGGIGKLTPQRRQIQRRKESQKPKADKNAGGRRRPRQRRRQRDGESIGGL
jgi:hypothetical protein